MPERPGEPVGSPPRIPERPTLEGLRATARDCRACDLWRLGTQAVFGEGPARAELMLVGEVPGDQEDRLGRPFVGPAGQLLDACLQEAGIDRARAYVTNVVKHFKWEPRGKRRIHQKPSAGEIAACRPWLDAEIACVRPRLIVCLGATAAQALLGKDFRVTRQRGQVLPSLLGPPILATIHPSAILRAEDAATQAAETRRFVEDLQRAAAFVAGRADA